MGFPAGVQQASKFTKYCQSYLHISENDKIMLMFGWRSKQPF